MLAYAILAVGFLLLAAGGESFLRGAIGLSKVLRLPPLFVGLFVVSVGGVLPQLSVALQAVEHEAPDIAFGSIVGANIFTILLVFGLSALMRAIPCPPKIVFRDGGTMLVASLALALFAATGIVVRWMGIGLLLGAFVYFVLSFITDWRRPVSQSLAENRALARQRATKPATSAFLLTFGLVCLLLGGHFTVDGAMAVAQMEHVSQDALALTLVAAGIMLPLLYTTFAASARGQPNVVAGELIGANALNILFVLGLSALVHPVEVSHEVAQADVYVAVATAGIVIAMMLPGWRITRFQGAILVLSYLGYLTFVAWRQGLVAL